MQFSTENIELYAWALCGFFSLWRHRQCICQICRRRCQASMVAARVSMVTDYHLSASKSWRPLFYFTALVLRRGSDAVLRGYDALTNVKPKKYVIYSLKISARIAGVPFLQQSRRGKQHFYLIGVRGKEVAGGIYMRGIEARRAPAHRRSHRARPRRRRRHLSRKLMMHGTERK